MFLSDMIGKVLFDEFCFCLCLQVDLEVSIVLILVLDEGGKEAVRLRGEDFLYTLTWSTMMSYSSSALRTGIN